MDVDLLDHAVERDAARGPADGGEARLHGAVGEDVGGALRRDVNSCSSACRPLPACTTATSGSWRSRSRPRRGRSRASSVRPCHQVRSFLPCRPACGGRRRPSPAGSGRNQTRLPCAVEDHRPPLARAEERRGEEVAGRAGGRRRAWWTVTLGGMQAGRGVEALDVGRQCPAWTGIRSADTTAGCSDGEAASRAYVRLPLGERPQRADA